MRAEQDVPTYQYACNVCSHEFEAVQSFSDDSLTNCPKCKGEIRKIYSAVGVVFKGSGFYKNDSQRANKADSESKSEQKTEPKALPAASSEKSATAPTAAPTVTTSSTTT